MLSLLQVSRIRLSPVPTQNLFCESITKNVLVSDLSTVVVLVYFIPNMIFMLYELFLFYLSACVALVSVLFSLIIASTEGRIACNSHCGTLAHYSTQQICGVGGKISDSLT